MTDRTFDDIYRLGRWGQAETRSGPGSRPRATAHLAEWLEDVVQRHRVTSVFDAACGEGLWMPPLPNYVGADLVPAAVEAAQRNHPDRDFRVLDVRHDPLPRADLVIFRDALQHMPSADGLDALRNIRRSGARLLVVGSYARGRNRDIAATRWYAVNLERPPFDFGPPLERVPDGRGTGRDRHLQKYLGLWAV